MTSPFGHRIPDARTLELVFDQRAGLLVLAAHIERRGRLWVQL